VLSESEFQEKLLNLGFGHLKMPRAKQQSNALKGTEKYTWREGLIVRQKAHFFTQWIGRQFHEILKEQPGIFAVHSYYLQDGDTFETLLAMHKPSPNAIVVVHDHTIHSYCTPWSKCRELKEGDW